MDMNQYIAAMVIGLGMSNWAMTKANKDSPRQHVRHIGDFKVSLNFSGANFALATLAFLICGSFACPSPSSAFCTTTLIAEAFNFKWRDYRSSAYAAFVGIETLLMQHIPMSTAFALITAIAVAMATLALAWRFGSGMSQAAHV